MPDYNTNFVWIKSSFLGCDAM